MNIENHGPRQKVNSTPSTNWAELYSKVKIMHQKQGKHCLWLLRRDVPMKIILENELKLKHLKIRLMEFYELAKLSGQLKDTE